MCTPDDGQRNFSKYVEFYSKNKCEKLVDLVGFIIRGSVNNVGYEVLTPSSTIRETQSHRSCVLLLFDTATCYE